MKKKISIKAVPRVEVIRKEAGGLSQELPRKSSPKTLFLVMLAAIFFVSFAVYFYTLYNGFVWDDMTQVLENKWIRDVSYLPNMFSENVWSFQSEHSNYYRPLMHVIYMFTYFVSGLKPWGFHLVNVLLHAGNSLLVFLAMSKLLGRSASSLPPPFVEKGMEGSLPVPFAAALLFAVHPIHTEAVSWVAGLPDLSFTFFYLLSFSLYISSAAEKQIHKWRYVLSILSFSFAVLCKEPALTLPAVLLIYDYAFKKDNVFSFHFRRYAPYFAVGAVYLILRFHVLSGFAPEKRHQYLSTYQYIINVLPLFSQYLEKLVFPFNLNAFYVFHPVSSLFDAKCIVALVIMAGFVFFVFMSWKKNRLVFFSLLLIIVPLLPALYIPALGENTFAERYLYLPSFGFVLFISILISRLTVVSKKAVTAYFFFAVIAVLYSTGTLTRNSAWKDNYSLFSDTVKKSPDSALIRSDLGKCLREQGRLDEAIQQYQIAIELDPELAEAHDNLGVAYYSKGWVERAIEQHLLALKLYPGYVNAYYNLGSIYANSGHMGEAIQYFTKALKSRPNNTLYRAMLAKAHYVLATNKSKLRQIDDALEHFKAAVELQPADAAYRNMLGVTYGQKGLYDMAIEQFETAIRLAPGEIMYRQNLNMAFGLRNAAIGSPQP
jgi:tetratricopeptide (TPR) repeat protein